MLLLRPTESKGLYMQQVGRGLRTSSYSSSSNGNSSNSSSSSGIGAPLLIDENRNHPEGRGGGKQFCYVLDLAGNTWYGCMA